MGNCIKRNRNVIKAFKQEQTIEEMTTNAVHFVVPISEGWCISVYDGDTITIATNLNINGTTTLYKFNVRIRGIDCPEMRSKNNVEKQYAIKAKELVQNLCYGKCVKLANVSYDKYGRILADVYCDDILIAQRLLNSKLAVEYNGKQKTFVNWNYMQ